MKSVSIPSEILRLYSREREFSVNSLDEISVPSHPINKFSLETSSSDHVYILFDTDSDYPPTSSSQVFCENHQLYWQILQLTSSPITPPLEHFHQPISLEIINKLDESQGASPLHYACMNGNLSMVKFLLENGAHVNIWDAKKAVTPLACAAAHGHLEILELLLENDCDLNAGLNNSKSGPSTALLWAVRMGQAKVVRYLLDRNAYQNSNIPFSETPIHAAVIAGSREILEMLITAQGLNVKAEFQMGSMKETPLHVAASGKYPNSLDICKILLEKGKVKVDLLNRNGQTPLYYASASREVDILNLLLAHWANPDAVDDDRRTPLFYMIRNADEKMLECLRVFLTKCDINHQDKQGNTVLHYAAIEGVEETVEILLLNGADFSIKANSGYSALFLLKRKIPNIKELIEKSFDQAVRVINSKEYSSGSRPECRIEVDFQYVLPSQQSDASMHLDSLPLPRKSNEKLSGTSGISRFFRDEEKTDKRASSYRKETSKIKCFIQEDLRPLLAHPVVHSFLEMKWRKARPLFLPTLTFKAILIILFTIYIHEPFVMRGNLDVKTMGVDLKDGAFNETLKSGFNDDLSDEQIPIPIWFRSAYYVIVFIAVLRGLMEFVHILRAPKPQLRTLHPWLSFAVLLIMIFYMRPKATYCSCKDRFQRCMAALAILLAWIDFWIDMGRFPIVGLSIRVFIRVFKNFSLFILPHFCLLFGFVFSFEVLFHENPEFKNIPSGIAKIFRMMAGDVSYEPEVKNTSSNSSVDEKLTVTSVITVYIFTAYVLIVSIVLMNLLIGLAVNDTQGIFAEATVHKLVKQTILLNTLESSFNSRWIKAHVPKRLFSAYINLFHSSSQDGKSMTFQPYDSSDCKIGSDQKIALLNIGHINERKGVSNVERDDMKNPSFSTNPHRWKKVVNELRKAKTGDDQINLMNDINALVSKYLAQKTKVN